MQHYMHVRTNASVGYKRKFHKHWNADIFWLNLLRRGWTLSSLLLSPESTASARGSTPTLLLTRLSAVPSLTLFRVPLPLPDTARFQVRKSFVWFRTETDKGIVCSGHPYSATVLLYWQILMNCLEKSLGGNYTRMMLTILNKYWKQHPTGQHLYGHLPSISQTNQVKQTRHPGRS